jgi:2-dehydro-3-deoxyphosphogluconate aldolase/(4S)-4-hydroxy-2-oxoglutarate aldolase
MTTPITSILAHCRVMPILTVHRERAAVQLARTLVSNGLTVFEVLLRTSCAAAAAAAMQRALPEAYVGLGTLLTERDVAVAVEAGVAFGVSPGLTAALAGAVTAAGLPFLPGVQTASEVMAARQHGFRTLKLFPANVVGGVAWLRGMAPVFPDTVFCPTGGIGEADVAAYLSLPNCPAVGGSWVVPPALLEAEDWDGIGALARRAAAFAEGRAT